MQLTIFGAGKLAILGFLATQFGSVLSAPAAEPVYINDLVKRTCTYPLKFGTPTNKFVILSYIKIVETLGAVLTINGDIGVSPSGTISNIPPASVTGTIHTNDASASSAIATASAACSCAAAALPVTTVAGTSITGSTFTAGNYLFPGAVNLAASGSTTFDAGGNANAQFIMIIEGALTTGASSKILLVNGAKACNIFWTVGAPPSAGAAVTLGASSVFNGNLCVWGPITTGLGVTYNGLMTTLLKTAASFVSIDGGTFDSQPSC